MSLSKSSGRGRLNSSLRPVRMLADADGRQRLRLVVAVDPVAVVVVRAGKSDHLPGRHVAVAAIDRVGEETLLRILEDLGEEVLPS